ncbi:DUF2207 domain-containing protein [Dethiosulfovibrio salsuginis]|uniref:Predicted membrane protein n=1 Tax=Dethiosulfovibrio salsuginis TaxID=561720 RepID=A0A1X7KIR8_9BACT|nr:DUF2207 domain-containing protein [Dethiosulfovibrio salsuginis]SMG41120.1 Predicted membrane protein [Dethiosulfovibrio salsuginis]
MKKLRFKALVLSLALFALPATAAEVITDFHSDVKIDQEGVLHVTETISVNAEGVQIKRGIFRDFPTDYRGKDGKTITVPFNVTSVTRDGKEEPWTTQGLSNGVRVRIGSSEVLLPRGEHRYTISYTTARQIGFFDEHDELYWNVTGNGWQFPILKASCRVKLPPGAEVLQLGAWTGFEGSKDRNATMTSEGLSTALFQTTRKLSPREGLTIAVSWPKGLVSPPGENAYFLTDYGMDLTFGTAALLGLIYFLWAWFKVGKDPRKGTIIPRFTPPEDLSPAATRQMSIMGFDNRSFSSAIISLAVKGYLIISEEEGLFKKYRLTKTSTDRRKDKPSKEEQRLFSVLLGSRESVLLKQESHEIIGAARDAARDTLESAYGHLYRRNIGYTVVGILLMIAVLVPGAFLFGRGEEDIAFSLGATAAATVAAVVFSTLIRTMRRRWRETKGIKALFAVTTIAIALAVLATVFGLSILVGSTVLYPEATWAMTLIALIPAIFIPIMRAPTSEGRALMDQVEGFAMYLKVAEEDRLNVLNPPEKTPELFERYLPYALALGLEQAWGDKFAKVLEAAQGTDGTYSPGWYAGTAPLHVGAMGSFASDLGSSFSSAVASSATAPGSDSAFSGGGGGGGSSGGGGGGGGGGGW